MVISLRTAALCAAIKHGTKNLILAASSSAVQLWQTDFCFTDQNGNSFSVLHLLLQKNTLSKNEIFELLEIFLKYGVDPNINSDLEGTALNMAVNLKMKKAVDLLLRYNADKNITDSEGNTITHYFVINEMEKFELALEKNLNLKSFIANTSAEYIEWLISRGFNFNRKNNEGMSSLHYAVAFNLQHILIPLLKNAKNLENIVGKYIQTLLHVFLENNYVYRLKYSNHLSKQKRYHDYSLHYTFNIIKTFLNRGITADIIDYDGFTSLQTAIQNNESWMIVRLLINHRLNNCNDKSATVMFLELCNCISKWDSKKIEFFLTILRKLVSLGANINWSKDDGVTAICCAIEAKNRKLVDFLIQHKAKFNVITKSGENLFHALAKRLDLGVKPNKIEQEKLFDFIAKKGCCDMNKRNKYNETPIHLAARHENLTIVKKLIANGAEVNCQDNQKQTPLHKTLELNIKNNISKLILENGTNVDVNSRDIFGRRPLFYAAARGSSLLVSLLLERGAYVNDYTLNEFAFSKAITRNDIDNVKVMLAYGADMNDNRLKNLLNEMKWSDEIGNVLIPHMIKLCIAKLPCVFKMDVHSKSYEFYEMCLQEVEMMKNKIINKPISLYDWLHMNNRRKCIHVDNEKLENIVNLVELGELFPQYSVVILANYSQAVLRKSLIEPAIEALNKLVGVYLPDIIVDLIFSLLNTDGLVNLIESNQNFI